MILELFLIAFSSFADDSSSAIKACREDARPEINQKQVNFIMNTTKNFAGKKLIGVDFSFSDLSRSNFSGTLFCNTNFEHATFDGVKFKEFKNVDDESSQDIKTQFVGCSFDGSAFGDLDGSNVPSRNLVEFSFCKFKSTVMDGKKYIGFDADHCEFSYVHFDFYGEDEIYPIHISNSLIKNSSIKTQPLFKEYTGRGHLFDISNSAVKDCEFFHINITAKQTNFSFTNIEKSTFSIQDGTSYSWGKINTSDITGSLTNNDTLSKVLVCNSTLNVDGIENAFGSDNITVKEHTNNCDLKKVYPAAIQKK